MDCSRQISNVCRCSCATSYSTHSFSPHAKVVYARVTIESFYFTMAIAQLL